MRSTTSLADAEQEPTDEELIRLSTEAFGDVRRANEDSLRALRQRIATERTEVLRQLELRLARSTRS